MCNLNNCHECHEISYASSYLGSSWTHMDCVGHCCIRHAFLYSISHLRHACLCVLFIIIMKIHLGINGKMLKGYNEFIQYNITLISTSTNMSSIKSPCVGLFQDGGIKSHLGGAYLHFILSPKEVKTSAFFQISQNYCCL